MRVHLPVLLALSANSPFWRVGRDRAACRRARRSSARSRASGIPPRYRDWDDYSAQIEFMVASGVMEDYTYLWYDVRPHPRFGTVEIRVCDAQTRVEHTLGLAALIQAMVRSCASTSSPASSFGDYPWQMLDENKWLAARHGLDGELVDLPSNERVATEDARAPPAWTACASTREDLGSAARSRRRRSTCSSAATARSASSSSTRPTTTSRELMREIVEATVPH